MNNQNTKQDSFLPDDYKQPSLSKYTRLEKGANKFRILSNAITGFEYWVEETLSDGTVKRSPVRKRPNETIPVKDITDPPKHFWSIIVFNYRNNEVEIFNITQRSIQNAILALSKNEDWGNPKNYDITITKEGDSMMDTKYTIMPSPAKAFNMTDEIKTKVDSIYLEALYEGKDPFNYIPELEDVESLIDL